jgi:hypothetical protein
MLTQVTTDTSKLNMANHTSAGRHNPPKPPRGKRQNPILQRRVEPGRSCFGGPMLCRLQDWTLASICQPPLVHRMPDHPKQPHPKSIITCVHHRQPRSIECFHVSKMPQHRILHHPLPMPPKDTDPPPSLAHATQRHRARTTTGAHRIHQIEPRHVMLACFPTVSPISKNSAFKKVATSTMSSLSDPLQKPNLGFHPEDYATSDGVYQGSSTTPPRSKDDTPGRCRRWHRQGQAGP